MDVKNYEIVDGVEKLEEAVRRVREAQKIFATFSQEQEASPWNSYRAVASKW